MIVIYKIQSVGLGCLRCIVQFLLTWHTPCIHSWCRSIQSRCTSPQWRRRSLTMITMINLYTAPPSYSDSHHLLLLPLPLILNDHLLLLPLLLILYDHLLLLIDSKSSPPLTHIFITSIITAPPHTEIHIKHWKLKLLLKVSPSDSRILLLLTWDTFLASAVSALTACTGALPPHHTSTAWPR